MDLGLGGKRAVVAAASRGLGYAVASALAAEGARVAICSRDEERIREAADRIRTETGATVEPTVADVTNPAQTQAWIDGAATRFGGLDIAVPNAGGPSPGTFADTREEDWDAAYRLTLRSALTFARSSRAHLVAGSSVLFMTSASTRAPIGPLVLSTVFRGGVAALAKSLADEWAAAGIRVNHLIPGRIGTERLDEIDGYVAAQEGIDLAAVRARNAAAIPAGRYGDPQEFGAAAAFLLSDAASYITGATLQVDGGAIRSI